MGGADFMAFDYPTIIADSIVNICGAVGLGVAMMALYRRDPKSPLTKRLLLAIGVVTMLFFVRGAAWWSGNALLDRISLIPAALIPLGVLIVTEGMLRRHAPRVVKIAAAFGGLLLGIGGTVGLERFATPYYLVLSAFQLAGLLCCALLLMTRDRTSLMASENRSIVRLAVGALIVLPFMVTDFRGLFPDIPVRLGALGALLVVATVLNAGSGAETRRQGVSLTALRLASSALLGAAAACMSPDVDAAQIMRFCAVAISGVLAIGMGVDTLRALFESQAPGMLNAVAASAARTRDQLIAELARHPIFESARRYREADLSAYDPELLRDFLSRRQVLRRSEAPWGSKSSDPAVERTASLMKASNATHLMILSHDPLDVIVISVPVIAADPATETALELVHRLLVLTPEVAA
jgi:hypothetical protein